MRKIQSALAGLCLSAVGSVNAAHPYNDIAIFGDSLSDPGNVYELTGESSKPPFDAGNIPSRPYAKGGHHFTNGKTWSELLSKSLKLKSGKGPALKSSKYTNYAFGGARAHAAGGPFDLHAQVAAYLASTGGSADSDTLYVLFLGGNDIRDAIFTFQVVLQTSLLGGADMLTAIDAGETAAGIILAQAVTAISDTVMLLSDLGAQHFLIPNAPNLGLVPAITELGPDAINLGTQLSFGFNQGLETALAGLELALPVYITRFDVFGYMSAAINMPEAFGFDNVVDACTTPEVKKGAICKKAKGYFFWDGIHPTKTVHKQIAEAAEALLTGVVPPAEDGGSIQGSAVVVQGPVPNLKITAPHSSLSVNVSHTLTIGDPIAEPAETLWTSVAPPAGDSGSIQGSAVFAQGRDPVQVVAVPAAGETGGAGGYVEAATLTAHNIQVPVAVLLITANNRAVKLDSGHDTHGSELTLVRPN